jgi:pimeloyl-ACP methyl ester carboxylesterase
MLIPGTSTSLSVNGLSLHYEVHGAGRPLVLLHGGIGASEMFGPNLAALAASRQVIAVHLQGHGHTADIDRPLRHETMADDVAALIEALGIGPSDLLGYSLGGGVALQTAVRHPERVRRLIVVSAPMRSDAWYPEVAAAFAQMPANADMIAANIRQSPLAQMYPGVDWAGLFRKVGAMEAAGYDHTQGVAGLRPQTMLVFADADSMRPDHIVDFYKALGGGQRDAGLDGSQRPRARLAIVPDATHYDILSTTRVADLAAAFLDRSGD